MHQNTVILPFLNIRPTAESNVCVLRVALCNSCPPSPKGAQSSSTSCVNMGRLQDFHCFCPFVVPMDNTQRSNMERAEVEQVLTVSPCEPACGGGSSAWAAAAAVGIFTMLILTQRSCLALVPGCFCVRGKCADSYRCSVSGRIEPLSHSASFRLKLFHPPISRPRKEPKSLRSELFASFGNYCVLAAMFISLFGSL